MGFKVLVLCAKEHQPAATRFPGVEVLHAPNDDDFSRMPSRAELQTALKAARRVAERVASGDKALVTCWMGHNRSGLVNAFALHFLTGKDGLWCVKKITAVRRGALRNPGFQEVLANLRGVNPSVEPERF